MASKLRSIPSFPHFLPKQTKLLSSNGSSPNPFSSLFVRANSLVVIKMILPNSFFGLLQSQNAYIYISMLLHRFGIIWHNLKPKPLDWTHLIFQWKSNDLNDVREMVLAIFGVKFGIWKMALSIFNKWQWGGSTKILPQKKKSQVITFVPKMANR